MINNVQHPSLSAAAILLLASHATALKPRALDSTCNNSSGSITTFNATGSVEIAGFQYPSEGASNWTISTAVSYDNTTMVNSSYINQDFWINTNPVEDLSSGDLPYTGCAILIEDFQNTLISKGNTNGSAQASCSGALSDQCYTAIVNTAQQAAVKLSGTGPVISNSSTNGCQTIMNALDAGIAQSSCKSTTWAILQASNPFGNPTYNNLANVTDSTCSSNVGSGSSESAFIVAAGTGEQYVSGVDDYKTYNQFTKQATPLLMVVWSKNATETQAWADTRLVCVTASTIEAGSKAPSSSAGRVIGGWRLGYVGAIAGVAAVMSLL